MRRSAFMHQARYRTRQHENEQTCSQQEGPQAE
jgi:hypothetical protein